MLVAALGKADMAMADHTAIVTGANHGIGAATAAALAQRGGCGSTAERNLCQLG